jgi:hypothetical protein
MFLQMDNLKRREGINRGAMNIDQLDITARKTLAGGEIELEAKWKDALRELGLVVLPIAIKAVQGLTETLKGVIAFTREYPNLTRTLMVALGIVSTLSVLGGSFLLFRAGLSAISLILTGGAGAAAAGGLGATLLGIGTGLGALAVNLTILYGALKAGQWAGGGVVDYANKAFAPKGYDSVADWYVGNRSGGNYVKPGQASNGGGKQGDVYMDARKVGEIVTKHQSREAERPMGGLSGFDTRMSLQPIGAM